MLPRLGIFQVLCKSENFKTYFS